MSSKSVLPQKLCLNVRSTAAGYIRSHFMFSQTGTEWASTVGGSLLIGVKPNQYKELEMFVLAAVIQKQDDPSVWRAAVFQSPIKLEPMTTSYATTTYEVLEKSPRMFLEQREIQEERNINDAVAARRAVVLYMLSTETLLAFSAKGKQSVALKMSHEHGAVVHIPESTWDLL